MMFILVRHGETEWNATGAFRGRKDVPLNGFGRLQSHQMARRLRQTAIDLAVSSPLRRARETAEAILADHPTVRLEVEASFTDMDFGEWQGLKLEEVEERYPEEYRRWLAHPEQTRIPGGETLEGVARRATESVEAILKKSGTDANTTALIVSHGLVNKLLLCAMLSLGASHFWRINQEIACINIFEYTGSESKLLLLNDVCHLRPIGELLDRAKIRKTPAGRLEERNPLDN